MKEYEDIYLELLRAGLWNRPARMGCAIPWQPVIALAHRQSTCGPVYQAALTLAGDAAVPPRVVPVMQKSLMRTVNAHAAANRSIAHMVKALQEKGIDPILLKGQGIATYYLEPLLRQCGDIDLYVGPAHYEEACQVLDSFRGALSHPDGEEADDPHETEKHYSISLGGGLEVEIHRYTEVLESVKMNAIWQSFSAIGTTTALVPMTFEHVAVMTPNNDFNALYIFHHMWHHIMGMGIGMRQSCDWTMFLHRRAGQLDTTLLWHRLTALKLTRVWQVFGCVAVEHLGLPADEMPFYDPAYARRARRLLRYLLDVGDNRDFKFGRSAQPTKKKAATLRFIFSKTHHLLPIFPRQAVHYFVHSVTAGLGNLLMGHAVAQREKNVNRM